MEICHNYTDIGEKVDAKRFHALIISALINKVSCHGCQNKTICIIQSRNVECGETIRTLHSRQRYQDTLS